MAGGRRARGAVLVAAVVASLALLPVLVGAAPVDWAGSKYDSPALSDMNEAGTRGEATMTTQSFPLLGRFARASNGDGTRRITNVGVAFNRATQDGQLIAREANEPCLPGDVPNAVAAPEDNSGNQAKFTVRADQSNWPCNGRYLATATARSNGIQGPDQFSLVAELTVAVRPAPVTEIAVDVDDENDRVTVSWTKLTAEEKAVDAIGYRVERAGPADSKGVYGFFKPIGPDVSEAEVAEVERPAMVDSPEENGKYRYRVMSLRNGADGPVIASSDGTAVTDAAITPDPTKPTTTTTTEPGSSTTTTAPEGPRIGNGRPIPTIPNRPGARLPAPPTTVDPGFDPELNYDGTPRLPSQGSDSPELAGEEGLSVIQNEGEGGTGMLGPVAGAMVLIGWAGHVVYLNRLAKQF